MVICCSLAPKFPSRSRNRTRTAALSGKDDNLLVNARCATEWTAAKVCRKLLREVARLSWAVITHDEPHHRSPQIYESGIVNEDFSGIRTPWAE